MQYNYTVRPSFLYIHWPFCPYKCHFCNFVAIAGHDQYMEQYHYALCKELETFFSHYPTPLPIETIFIGGGTPSTYPTHLLLDMSDKLKKAVTLSKTVEFTIEVNPGTVHPEQLDLWKDAGINRISMGVQSLNDMVLKKLNRHQSSEDVIKALHMMSERFDVISVDLILGLPGVTPEQWYALLEKVVTWPIKHISIYFLMVHENTPLYFGVKTHKITLPCDDEVVDLYYASIAYLAGHGFIQYEISNFAKKGYESKHNKAYWQRKPFKGFGLGACSFDGGSRQANEKNLTKYMTQAEKGESLTSFHETLTRKQSWLEKIMLGLRQTTGINIQELMSELEQNEHTYIAAQIEELASRNLIKIDQGLLALTPSALAVENEVILKLSL